VVSAFRGLCAAADKAPAGLAVETAVVRALARGASFFSGPLADLPAQSARSSSIQLHAFPDFGLYIYRTPVYRLAIRCGRLWRRPREPMPTTTSCLSNWRWEAKPSSSILGVTCILRPLAAQPVSFDRHAQHGDAGRSGTESLSIHLCGLFTLQDQAMGAVVRTDSRTFEGQHFGFGVPCRRCVTLGTNTVDGVDTCSRVDENGPSSTLRPRPGCGWGARDTLGWNCLESAPVCTPRREGGKWSPRSTRPLTVSFSTVR